VEENQRESLLPEQIQHSGQYRAAERPQVQQQHMIDVVPVHRLFAREVGIVTSDF
jgi:hypothetical protein